MVIGISFYVVNACLLAAMSNQELIDAGKKTMDETDQAIERSKQVCSYLYFFVNLLLQRCA